MVSCFGLLGVFTAPYFINPASLGWSAKYGYILFGSNAVLFIFKFFYVPETRDRTLEEINEMVEANLPARKFKGYICTGTAAMHHANPDKEVEVQELETTSQAGEVGKGDSTARTAQV